MGEEEDVGAAIGGASVRVKEEEEEEVSAVHVLLAWAKRKAADTF